MQGEPHWNREVVHGPPVEETREPAQDLSGENGAKRSIMLADVKTAFLNGDARRSLYVELPPEDPLSASGRYVGKLERALYGTRDSPVSWQDHLRKTLLGRKFKESVTHPGVVQHETRNIFLCVHVDDLLCTGQRDELTWLMKQIQKEYEYQTILMGDDDDMEKKAVNLGRTREWSVNGLGSSTGSETRAFIVA